MLEGFSAYEKGLDEKQNLEHDKKAATTKAPTERLGVLQQKPWIQGCVDFGHKPDLSITYLKHKNITPGQFQDINKAISYMEQSDTGSRLLNEIRAKLELMVGVHFFANIGDYPWQNDVSPNEGGHVKLMSTLASPVVLFWATVFVTTRRTPECIAETLFHELLHVWFIATKSGNEFETGHASNANTAIDSNCNKIYTGYDPDFQKMEEAFDNDLAHKIPGAKKCCS